MPKAELHVHLEGSITPENLFFLARKNKLKLNLSSPDALQKFYNYRNFDDFKRLLLACISVLKTPDDFHFLAHNLGKRFIEQNIKYAEVYWTPQLYRRLGYSYDDLFGALSLAATEIRQQHDIHINWIPDLIRSRPGPAFEVMRWASKESSRQNGVVALGLAGPEKGLPLQPFIEVFKEARKRGLPANPHSGEGTNANLVAETVQALQPARIGHGVSCVEDKRLVQYLAQEQIALEICLSSNVQLCLYPDYASHPLMELLHAGCRITLHTDDPALFRTTLNEEYFHAINKCGMTATELENTALNALKASYLNPVDKQRLLTDFTEAYSQLRPSATRVGNES